MSISRFGRIALVSLLSVAAACSGAKPTEFGGPPPDVEEDVAPTTPVPSEKDAGSKEAGEPA
ncbi:MAG TPA: hypothetical protein VM580_26675, partial [Labilithrix sp.]|nr:hypothetical protein [Labilithrix sp.]